MKASTKSLSDERNDWSRSAFARRAQIVIAACLLGLAPSFSAALDDDVWIIEDPCPAGAYQPPSCGAVEIRRSPQCAETPECPDGFLCRRVWHPDESAYRHRCARPRAPRFDDYFQGPGQLTVKDGPPVFGGDFVTVVAKGFENARFEGVGMLFLPFECGAGSEAIAEVRPRIEDPGLSMADRLRAVVLSAHADGRVRVLASADAPRRGEAVRLAFACQTPRTHLIGAGVLEGIWPYAFKVRVGPPQVAGTSTPISHPGPPPDSP